MSSSDVADDIRKAVNETRGPAFQPRPADEEFAKLRAHVVGTLIAAKRQLVPGDEWLVTDMRFIDIAMTWLESNRR